MIDKRDLDNYELEYKELALADLTDKVGSIGDVKYRALRFSAIEDAVGQEIARSWFNEVEAENT